MLDRRLGDLHGPVGKALALLALALVKLEWCDTKMNALHADGVYEIARSRAPTSNASRARSSRYAIRSSAAAGSIRATLPSAAR
jgi:hypothetical protein